MDDALRYAIEHGLLNSSQILVQVAVAKRKDIKTEVRKVDDISPSQKRWKKDTES